MSTLHRPHPTLSSLLRATAIRSINVKEQGEEKEERKKIGKEERLEKLMNKNRTEKLFDSRFVITVAPSLMGKKHGKKKGTR
jgi:hypothetical protein